MIAPRPLKPRPRHRWRYLLALMAVLIAELLLFNMPHFLSLSTAGNQASSQSSTLIGSGLERNADGTLTVTEPTKAYIQVDRVRTKVGYVHVTFSDPRGGQDDAEPTQRDSSVQIRLDALAENSDDQQFWDAGNVVTVRENVDASTYIRSPAPGKSSEGLRLWIQEPTGSTVGVKGLDINPRVPFRVNVLRAAILAVIAVIILAFLPHSWLWRTRLRSGNRRQGLLLCGVLTPFALLAISVIVGSIAWPGQQIFHNANGYTYDFNQYGYIADALLHGRPWLDLKVPDQLLLSQNPLDIATRQKLLDQGVQPLYWDYVLFEGRWYSYFGVLPAIVLFLPYQAITSLWVPGGLMLPSEAANALLLFIAMVLMILLVIRIIKRHFEAMPLAVVALGSITVITASNLVYLWHKANFYTVPFAASLVLSALGLWIWLGARRVSTQDGTRMWRFTDIKATLRDDLTTTLSLKRVALGSICLGANVACRPQFILACLLALPIFWDEIVALLSVKHVKYRYAGTIRAGKRVQALLLFAASAVRPAALAVIGALTNNLWRFGSPLDFGNLNQMTVVNLQTYQTPLGNIPRILGYYLAQPPSLGSRFPWISYAPAPLPHWQYTESGVGGILLLCPVLIVLLLLPSLRRTLRSRRLFGLACSLPALAVLIIVFDAYAGGFVWRYMADFGWLLGLSSVMVIAAVAERRDGANPNAPGLATVSQSSASKAAGRGHVYHEGCARSLVIGLMTVLVLAGLLTSLLAGAAISMHSNPDAYAQMQSWLSF
ncbi:hypothetical protein [Bifidobacterium crudilactis]|uniref:hypothetical protein n=1 Tax=Bifidobacterium crudilactis TaxID=327277 RepID=UPI002648E14E|nr:hypothetical protein [Bifidobacterium crudilactis]MDN6209205.1 hypothetical protein [Bifidobacterium crudilactis]